MALPRPCLICGKPTRGARCQAHAIPDYPYRERQRMAATVKAWRQQHGDWCPGYGVPPHPATNLTADHVVAWSKQQATSTLAVLCHSCNARKNDRDTLR